MSDPRARLEAIADELRKLRVRLEDENNPFDVELGRTTVMLADVTQALRAVAACKPRVETFHA